MPRELSKKLRELRGNMSLREANKRTGLSHTYIRELEHGIDPRTGKEVMPSIATLKTLASAYGCDYGELLLVAGYIQDDSILSESDRFKLQVITDDVESGMSIDQLMDRHTIWIDGKRITADEWQGIIAYVRAVRAVRKKEP